MQFPMRDAMTVEQRARNQSAQEHLIPGKNYLFDPPVTATAIPTGGPSTCVLEECAFNRGCYMGFVDDQHVFQGKPINDTRIIPVPKGYEDFQEYGGDIDDMLEQLRDSYFTVLFIGGSTAIPMDD